MLVVVLIPNFDSFNGKKNGCDKINVLGVFKVIHDDTV